MLTASIPYKEILYILYERAPMLILQKPLLLENGKRIYCQISTHNQSNGNIFEKPWVLYVPGGPGFGHLSTEPMANSVAEYCMKHKLGICNSIHMDPLECGKLSDRVTDPVNEFTIPFFAEIVCQLIEAISKEFTLKTMDVRIVGISFGSMVAMTVPTRRPDWILNPSKIHLRQIISLVGPVSYQQIDRARLFLVKNYRDNPEIKTMMFYLNKLLTGTIESMDEYQKMAISLGPLYKDDYDKVSKSFIGKFIKEHQELSINILGFLGYFSKKCNQMYNSLTTCAIDELNYFFRNRFNGFNLLTLIDNNMAVYQKANITLVTGSLDHLAQPEDTANLIVEKLQLASSFVLRSKHGSGPCPPSVLFALLGLTLNGLITESFKPKDIAENEEDVVHYGFPNNLSTTVEMIRKAGERRL